MIVICSLIIYGDVSVIENTPPWSIYFIFSNYDSILLSRKQQSSQFIVRKIEILINALNDRLASNSLQEVLNILFVYLKFSMISIISCMKNRLLGPDTISDYYPRPSFYTLQS